MAGRRFLVPEVIQTSGMDCGPAALAALAAGFDVPAGYSRLREACQTDVDGTSIDALEDIARALGLDATQVLVPADHVATGELPAIALVRSPEGIFHFVVAWRRVGRWVQLMDPTVGRRWTTVRRFREDLVIHEMDIPAEAVTGFARSPSFAALLAARLVALGRAGGDARADVARAVEDGPAAVYALDAATRTAARAGADHAVVAGLAAHGLADPAALPAGCWFARPADDGDDGPMAHLRGAVLVTVPGELAPEERMDRSALPEALRDATTEPRPSPAREVAALAGGRQRLLWGALLAIAVGAMGPAVGWLGRRAIDGESIGPLAMVAWAVLIVEVAAAGFALATGRRVEASFRRALFDRVPRLPDHYFRSRPTSDSAERAHRIHGVHELPPLALIGARSAAELLAVGMALVLLRPSLVLLAIGATAASVGIPLLAAPLQQERDLRVRTHGGALARSWLDAVAGRMPLRAHRAEAALEHDNEWLLEEWSAAAGKARRLAVVVEAVQAAVGVLFAVGLVAAADRRGADGPEVLLVAFWALRVVALGQTLAAAVRTWPLQRAVTMRFLEPLAAPLDGPDPVGAGATTAPEGRGGVAVELDGVAVEASGHVVLDDCTLSLRPGEHVAIVGPSGAGKTTLVGLLLGWSRPVRGSIRIDGTPLDPQQRIALRAATAWIAPDVALWRGPLVDNVGYGSTGLAADELAAIADASELTQVITTLPDGWASPLGDSGRRLSGGEGQRVRVARALARRGVRLAVLDEAFRGMPLDQRTRLLGRCRAQWSGATLVHVTHDVIDALDFDRVLVVDGGRIVEDGNPTELSAQAGTRFASLLESDRARIAVLNGPGWRRLDLAAGRIVGDQDHTSGAADAADSGLGAPRPMPEPATPEQIAALRAAVPRWWPSDGAVPAGADLPTAAAALGLRAEQLGTTRAGLAATLSRARRAVVGHRDGGASAVRRGRGDAGALADRALGAPATLPPMPGLDPEALAALQAAEVAEQPVPGVWRVRPDPSVALRAAARWAGIPARLLGYALAHILEIGAYVLAFSILGRDALNGAVTGSTIVGFGLALALAVPARAASVGLGQRVAVDAGRILKRRLLRGALSLPPDAAREEGVGRVMGRIVEAEAVEDQAVSGALNAVVSVVELVAAALVLRAGVEGGVAVAGLAVWAGLAAVAMRALTRRRRAWAAARLEVSLDLVEKLLGQRTRVVQQPPDQWSIGEAESVAAARAASRRVDRLTTLLLAGLAPAWLALGATGLVVADSSDRTLIATSLGGILLAASGLERLGRGSADLAGAVAAFDACLPLSRAAAPLPPAAPTDPDSPFAADVADLDVRHPQRSEPILEGVSTAIARRDRVVLRGPSGAGKSTLAAVLAGIREPDGGTVRRRGDVVLAAQFHENHVLLAPLAFNLLMGRGWPHSEDDLAAAREVCIALGLDRVISRMPSRLEQMVGETGWQLSHGETHLLNVARALLQGGQLVILDESLGALDPATAGAALEVLGDAAPAVLVIAQD